MKHLIAATMFASAVTAHATEVVTADTNLMISTNSRLANVDQTTREIASFNHMMVRQSNIVTSVFVNGKEQPNAQQTIAGIPVGTQQILFIQAVVNPVVKNGKEVNTKTPEQAKLSNTHYSHTNVRNMRNPS